MNTIQEMYTHAYNNRKEKKEDFSFKIAISGDMEVKIAYFNRKCTPIISLRDMSLAGEANWCLVVCLYPSSNADLFRSTRQEAGTS